jgi:hypothetical protein
MVFQPQWSQCKWLLTTISMLGIDACRRNRFGQRHRRSRQFHALTAARIQFVAAARIQQDSVFARFDDVAIEAQRQPVQFVGRRLAAP